MDKTNYEIIMEQYDSMNKREITNEYHRWYNLKQVGELKNISYKSCKTMVHSIYEANKADGTIYKKGTRYFISHHLLDQFELKQKRKDNIYTHQWKSNISWTTKDFYSSDYHERIIEDLKNKTPEVQYIGCVEEDKAGRNHVHLLADAEPQQLKPIIAPLLNDYLDSDIYYRLYCEPVKNRGASVEYLKKNPKLIIHNTELKF